MVCVSRQQSVGPGELSNVDFKNDVHIHSSLPQCVIDLKDSPIPARENGANIIAGASGVG